MSDNPQEADVLEAAGYPRPTTDDELVAAWAHRMMVSEDTARLALGAGDDVVTTAEQEVKS